MPERNDALRPGAGQDGTGPDEAALAIVARHALHDEEVVAALAAGSLDGEGDADSRVRAGSLVERCPACRALHDDVAAITGSLRAASSFTAIAPRDFRLTVEDAHRLGGTVVTRRVVGGLRALLFGIARPVGASLAALGLVGVFVGAAVLGQAGIIGAPAADNATTAGGMQLASAAPGGHAAPGGPAAAPTSLDVAVNPEAQPKASERTASVPDAPIVRDAPTPGAATWLLGLSVVAFILGIAVFVIGARATRRRSPGHQGR